MHPKVAAILVGGQGVPGPIVEIEQETGRHFHFEGTEALPIDHFEVVLEGSREEVEERALPFREGEEVLVLIEEPHMYNEDDAVAKLDGYVISVAGAASLVGRAHAGAGSRRWAARRPRRRWSTRPRARGSADAPTETGDGRRRRRRGAAEGAGAGGRVDVLSADGRPGVPYETSS